MATDLALINAALTRVGEDPITELNDGSAGSDIAGQNYDQLVEFHLTNYPWTWATKTALLAQIDGEPDPPWGYMYQLPVDVRRLRVVTVDGIPIDYEPQFNKLLCDYDETNDLYAKYTWNVPEGYWPADFAEGIRQYLEAMFLRGIGERFEEAKDRETEAKRTMQAAKTADAQKRPPRNMHTSPTLAARTGGTTTSLATLPFRRA
jgi:hypothetical protein